MQMSFPVFDPLGLEPSEDPSFYLDAPVMFQPTNQPQRAQVSKDATVPNSFSNHMQEGQSVAAGDSGVNGSTLGWLSILALVTASTFMAGKTARPSTASQRRILASATSDEVDRYAHFRVPQVPTYLFALLAITASVGLLVVTPAMLVSSSIGTAAGFGAWAVKLTNTIQTMKVTNPLELTMAVGFLFKAIAEILAQVIPQNGDPDGAWLDPLRIFRSTWASLLSSSLSFYYWTRLPFVRALTAPGPVAALLGMKFGTSVTKMVVTQALYRPINVSLFLAFQSLFRGDSARQLVEVMRTKFKGGLIGGIAFFSVSNMIMFSIPNAFLHPIFGAVAGVIFNVWLAIVAYQK
jgi:hypothetical protein